MAKPPPTHDRFRIFCEIEVQDLGPILKQLADIKGLKVSTPELITDVITFRKRPEISSQDFLTAWIADHATFTTAEAVKAFLADGRAKTGAYPALNVLVDKKVLRRLGPGEYTRTDVKHLAPPKKAKAAKKHEKKLHEVTAHVFTLRLASRNHGRFNSNWLKRQFEADGRHPSGTGPVINRLMKDRAIKRVGEGEYVLLQKAEPKTNSAQPAAEVIANG